MSQRSRRATLAVVPVVAACFAGCTRPSLSNARQSVPTAPAAERQSYVDLQPGWRLSVITPILKSGGEQVQTLGEPQITGTDASLTVTLTASPNFLGYERSIYTVEASRRAGVRIRFASAELYRDGKPTPQSRPSKELFRLSGKARHVRLLYLVRASQADHNMALLAARTPPGLEAMTLAVQGDPAACATSNDAVCEWIPSGIAVRAESQRPGTKDWAPVR